MPTEQFKYSDFKPQVAQRVNKIYRNHTVKQKYHPIWHTALSFYEGNQWKKWSKTDKKLMTFQPRAISRQVTVNKIEKIVTTFVAHFVRELPTFYTTPGTTEPEDINSADISQTVLSTEYAEKLEPTLLDYFYWMYITGTGIRELVWDPMASGEIQFEDPDTNLKKTEEVPEVGQIYSRAVNPFNFYPVGGADIDSCTEILIVEPMPISEIKSRYNFDAEPESILVESSSPYSRDYEEGHQEKFEDCAKVFRYFRKKSDGFPDGLFACVINKKVVEYKENPFVSIGFSYPFQKSCAIPVPGQFWSRSPVEALRQIQIAYNYIYSLMVQAAERMGKMKWLVPQGSNLSKASLNEALGEIVKFKNNPNVPAPLQANLQPVPHYYFTLLDWLDKAFEDISGFHEVKSARLPTGANNPSGVLVNLLLEQDESRLSPAVKDYLRTVKDEARLYLKMAQLLYEETRIVRIVGEGKSAEVVDFTGSQLKGSYDVQVELAPMLSNSRAAWEETVKFALQAQIIDPKTALRKLKLEHPKTLTMELADEARAIRENTQLRLGKEVEIQEWDNDGVHLYILETYMKSSSYEALPDGTKEAFIAHRQGHQQEQARKFQQSMNAQTQQVSQLSAAQGQQPRAGGQAPIG